jgi:hypothetical protein
MTLENNDLFSFVLGNKDSKPKDILYLREIIKVKVQEELKERNANVSFEMFDSIVSSVMENIIEDGTFG